MDTRTPLDPPGCIKRIAIMPCAVTFLIVSVVRWTPLSHRQSESSQAQVDDPNVNRQLTWPVIGVSEGAGRLRKA